MMMYFPLKCFLISYEFSMTVDATTILPNTVLNESLLTQCEYFLNNSKTHPNQSNILMKLFVQDLRNSHINNQQVTLEVCPIFIQEIPLIGYDLLKGGGHPENYW